MQFHQHVNAIILFDDMMIQIVMLCMQAAPIPSIYWNAAGAMYAYLVGQMTVCTCMHFIDDN